MHAQILLRRRIIPARGKQHKCHGRTDVCKSHYVVPNCNRDVDFRLIKAFCYFMLMCQPGGTANSGVLIDQTPVPFGFRTWCRTDGYKLVKYSRWSRGLVIILPLPRLHCLHRRSNGPWSFHLPTQKRSTHCSQQSANPGAVYSTSAV